MLLHEDEVLLLLFRRNIPLDSSVTFMKVRQGFSACRLLRVWTVQEKFTECLGVWTKVTQTTLFHYLVLKISSQ